MRYWYNSFFKSLGVLFVLAVMLLVFAFTEPEAVQVSIGPKTHPITLTYHLPQDEPAACVTAGLVRAAHGVKMTAEGAPESPTVLEAAQAGLAACGLSDSDLITAAKLPEWMASTVAGFVHLTDTGDPCEFERPWKRDGVDICEPSSGSGE